MKSIDITIQDKEGLHARPAGILSKAAKGFESKVTMTKNGKVADMKKIFAVMGLAVKCGETVTIAADGPDEDAAIEELTKQIGQNVEDLKKNLTEGDREYFKADVIRDKAVKFLCDNAKAE